MKNNDKNLVPDTITVRTLTDDELTHADGGVEQPTPEEIQQIHDLFDQAGTA